MSEFQAKLGADAFLCNSNLNVISKVLAGMAHSLYGNLDFLADQVNPKTACGEFLENWSKLFGVTRNPARAANGNVTATGIEGAVIPSGTPLSRPDGTQYTTTEEVVIGNSGDVSISIQAVVTGPDSNYSGGAVMQFDTAITQVDTDLTVELSGISGGVDIETDEALRNRLCNRVANPPVCGNKATYEALALDFPGVTRAFVTANEFGAGIISIRFLMEDLYPDNFGIPTLQDIQNLQSAIDNTESCKPLGVCVKVFGIDPCPVDINISGIVPNCQQITDEIRAEITDAFRRRSVPGQEFKLNWITQAIGNVAGINDYTLTLPTADIQPNNQCLIIPNNISIA